MPLPPLAASSSSSPSGASSCGSSLRLSAIPRRIATTVPDRGPTTPRGLGAPVPRRAVACGRRLLRPAVPPGYHDAMRGWIPALGVVAAATLLAACGCMLAGHGSGYDECVANEASREESERNARRARKRERDEARRHEEPCRRGDPRADRKSVV